jgi:hypothetical protein
MRAALGRPGFAAIKASYSIDKPGHRGLRPHFRGPRVFMANADFHGE